MTSEHARLWTGSQKPHYGRMGCARINKMSPERIRAQWIWGPGSYGRSEAI